MEAIYVVPAGWLLAAVMMASLWAVQRRLGNAAIVDVGWPAGVPLLAVFYVIALDGYSPAAGLATAAAVLWGGRLAIYLYRTRIRGGREEEGRYRELRREWGAAFQRKLFLFYQFQAALDVVFALPFLLLAMFPMPQPPPVFWLGLGLWGIAFAGEALADLQLTRFRARPDSARRVCEEGLWRYSRHPNYFFEFLVWVAFALMALAVPWGWLAWVCPALMLLFLFRITGIPATEAQAVRSKGEAYRRYQQTTSAFVPWFRRAPAPLHNGRRREQPLPFEERSR